MTRIGIVGAGAAAAAATYALEETLEEPAITVLEKSRGVCGRAATTSSTTTARITSNPTTSGSSNY